MWSYIDRLALRCRELRFVISRQFRESQPDGTPERDGILNGIFPGIPQSAPRFRPFVLPTGVGMNAGGYTHRMVDFLRR
jgi:hypothetical protein